MKAGIIGLGVGEQHIEGYIRAGCQVKTICDTNIEKLKEVQFRYPFCNTTLNYLDIIGDPDINIVSVASYDNFHAEQVIVAIQNGKHVFVEKPLCQTREEAIKIRRELEKNPNVHISSNLILRRYPRFLDVKRRVERKEFGDVYYIEADYEYGRLHKLTDGWRGEIPFYSVIQGGGIHMIDIILWLLGDKPIEVMSMGNNISCKNSKFRYNDFVVTLLRFKSGLIAKISCNFGCVLPHFHELKIFGTRATYINSLPNAMLFSSRCSEDSPKILNIPYPGCFKGDIIPNFVNSIIGKESAEVTSQEIFDSLSVCLSAEESLVSGKAIKVEYL